jgi:hypothetical protein
MKKAKGRRLKDENGVAAGCGEGWFMKAQGQGRGERLNLAQIG